MYLQFGIWTAYPAAFSVLVSLMIVPSALALSQRRLFFVSARFCLKNRYEFELTAACCQWLLLLVPACIAHGSMSVYGIMLEHELYSIATARMHKVWWKSACASALCDLSTMFSCVNRYFRYYQCTEIRMVECDRWALRNLAEDFAPMADTAVAFGFLMFFVLVCFYFVHQFDFVPVCNILFVMLRRVSTFTWRCG
jgi:hypothetical protein